MMAKHHRRDQPGGADLRGECQWHDLWGNGGGALGTYAIAGSALTANNPSAPFAFLHGEAYKHS
jgi:hypothetical protein